MGYFSSDEKYDTFNYSEVVTGPVEGEAIVSHTFDMDGVIAELDITAAEEATIIIQAVDPNETERTVRAYVGDKIVRGSEDDEVAEVGAGREVEVIVDSDTTDVDYAVNLVTKERRV